MRRTSGYVLSDINIRGLLGLIVGLQIEQSGRTGKQRAQLHHAPHERVVAHAHQLRVQPAAATGTRTDFSGQTP